MSFRPRTASAVVHGFMVVCPSWNARVLSWIGGGKGVWRGDSWCHDRDERAVRSRRFIHVHCIRRKRSSTLEFQREINLLVTGSIPHISRFPAPYVWTVSEFFSTQKGLEGLSRGIWKILYRHCLQWNKFIRHFSIDRPGINSINRNSTNNKNVRCMSHQRCE